MGRGLFCTCLGRSQQKGPGYRFLAIREVIRTEGIPGDGSAATISHSELGEQQYKLFGVVLIGIWLGISSSGGLGNGVAREKRCMPS